VHYDDYDQLDYDHHASADDHDYHDVVPTDP